MKLIVLLAFVASITPAFAGHLTECADPDSDSIACLGVTSPNSVKMQWGNTNAGNMEEVSHGKKAQAPEGERSKVSNAEYFSGGVFVQRSVLKDGNGKIEVLGSGDSSDMVLRPVAAWAPAIREEPQVDSYLAALALVTVFSSSSFADNSCDPTSQQPQTQGCMSPSPPSQPDACSGKQQGDLCGVKWYNPYYSSWEQGSCMPLLPGDPISPTEQKRVSLARSPGLRGFRVRPEERFRVRRQGSRRLSQVPRILGQDTEPPHTAISPGRSVVAEMGTASPKASSDGWDATPPKKSPFSLYDRAFIPILYFPKSFN